MPCYKGFFFSWNYVILLHHEAQKKKGLKGGFSNYFKENDEKY
jgi:hypothetical protein